LDFHRATRKLRSAMARISQLLAAHGSILVLDAASQRVQIGLFRINCPTLWAETIADAGRGLFSAAEHVLTKAELSIADIGVFVFCEGPGSMLGTRTVAMALRTWLTLKQRPLFAYQSLALAALGEWNRSPRAFAAIADARRESWHRQPVGGNGILGPLERYATCDLPGGELLTPTEFRVWSKPPENLTARPYDLTTLFAAIGDADLFRPVETPAVLQHDAPDYKKWSAQPHSAETAVRR
jgi:tRNA threonylcarbamoyladenosine biosynthesis protein TsaB